MIPSMLFGYPPSAIEENWLHDSLCNMLRLIHRAADADEEPPAWPSIIPARDRSRLASYRGLRDRLNAYSAALSSVSAEDRSMTLRCMSDQNEIGQLLSCDGDCEVIDNLPEVLRTPIRELFVFAFGMLAKLGIRDRQYKKVYAALTNKVCPFCGCEPFEAPGAPRADLDHYLSKRVYSFAAANLGNLAPMGTQCNTRYKLAQDILRDSSGSRRRAFNPYGHDRIRISLDESEPFAGSDGILPLWQIDFIPDSPECDTWDDVFCVRERFRRDTLDVCYLRWLRAFSSYARTQWPSVAGGAQDAGEVLRAYTEIVGIVSGREFLHERVFHMLCKHYDAGNARVIEIVRILAGQAASGI